MSTTRSGPAEVEERFWVTPWSTPATGRYGSSRSGHPGLCRRRSRPVAALTKHERLRRLEKATSERKVELTEEQIRLLERFSPEFRDRHSQPPHTGSLMAVDTFFVGTLKGVGKVYRQTAIDCHSRYGWARLYPKLYPNKTPVTAFT